MTQVGLELEINLLQPPPQPPRPLMGSSILRLSVTVEQAVRCYTHVTQPEHYTYQTGQALGQSEATSWLEGGVGSSLHPIYQEAPGGGQSLRDDSEVA